ncbi:MAG: response regulator [Deltaproteobacteria bacterium RIFOXYD12_FULL_57_12]|nr:MAG: response regulator [Deltaproteobacteria bacterium RIFOXYD12_FULL_57_12]
MDIIVEHNAGQPAGPTRILIVDDELYICKTISRWLEKEGYECLVAANTDEALDCLEKNRIDLLISDINMPGRSGIELLRITRERFPLTAVLMATAVDSREVAIRALEIGAYGYMIKPFDKNEFIINVANALERLRLTLQSLEYERRLEQEVHERTVEIRSREEEIALHLVWASEYRDDDTGEHIRRIGLFSAELARVLGWGQAEIDNIRVAAPMHDVGKIGIPDSILLKPGKLTPEEFATMKTHTVIGANILGHSKVPLLKLASTIALSHHEKWDGSGYPNGLRGEDIPMSARIVAIADVYDALVYDRVYRPAFLEEEALRIMQEESGSHFDPSIFACFLSALPVFREIRKDISETKMF